MLIIRDLLATFNEDKANRLFVNRVIKLSNLSLNLLITLNRFICFNLLNNFSNDFDNREKETKSARL